MATLQMLTKFESKSNRVKGMRKSTYLLNLERNLILDTHRTRVPSNAPTSCGNSAQWERAALELSDGDSRRPLRGA